MDWFLVKWVNSEYPLSRHKCAEKRLFLWWPLPPLKCVAPPKKWYHHVAQLSAHLKTPSLVDHWSLLHQENFDFLRAPYFGKSTQNGSGVTKSWHTSKVTIRCHKRCISCLESKFAKKFQWEESQIADNRFPCVMLLGGLSVNLNHLKMEVRLIFKRVPWSVTQ